MEKKKLWSGLWGIVKTIICGAEVRYNPKTGNWSVRVKKKV